MASSIEARVSALRVTPDALALAATWSGRDAPMMAEAMHPGDGQLCHCQSELKFGSAHRGRYSATASGQGEPRRLTRTGVGLDSEQVKPPRGRGSSGVSGLQTGAAAQQASHYLRTLYGGGPVPPPGTPVHVEAWSPRVRPCTMLGAPLLTPRFGAGLLSSQYASESDDSAPNVRMPTVWRLAPM